MKFTEHELELQRLRNRIHTLEQDLESVQEDVAFLEALRSAGVDNWEGYEYAQEIFQEGT